MPDANEIALLREYAERKSESAFSEIVHKHVNLVYSIALRFTGNSEDAQDVTQAVFVILAKKAISLRPTIVLTGWLYETTRFTAMNFLTNKTRRQAREQEAYMQSILDSNTESVWRQLAPMLEEAMARLSEKERTLVALRFFENRSVAETAAALGIQEWAARKRVERAIEKLQQFFAKRGVTSTAATIAGAISANSVQAAPAALAKSATAVAIAKGAAASAPTVTLIKGALKIMAWTKAKTVIMISVAVILTASTTTTLIVQHQHAPERTEFPRASWAFAGYADPVAAFETGLWGVVQGDGKTLMASYSPRMQEDTTVKVGRQMQAQGKSLSPEEIFTQIGPSYIEGVTGFRILDKVTSDNQVILHLQIEGTEEKQTVTMKKIGKEWKIDDIQ